MKLASFARNCTANLRSTLDLASTADCGWVKTRISWRRHAAGALLGPISQFRSLLTQLRGYQIVSHRLWTKFQRRSMDARCVGRLSAPDPKRRCDALLLERLGCSYKLHSAAHERPILKLCKDRTGCDSANAPTRRLSGRPDDRFAVRRMGSLGRIPAGETAVSLHKYEKFRLTSARKPRI